MESPVTVSDPATIRRNYWAMLFEGGFFICGMGFVNAQTLLPALIIAEGGPSWVASFMPGIMIIGMFGVPILTARWVDGLRRLKPFAMTTGLFQRILYFPVALVFLYGEPSAMVIVVLLAATPLFSGLIGGIGFSAWQRLYMAAVPPEKRASNIAYRFLFAGLVGILGGYVIERTLERSPGSVGYGWLHLYAGVAFLMSLGFLARVREPAGAAVPSPKGEGSWVVLRRYFRRGPEQRSRVSFAATVVLMHSLMGIAPFFAVFLLMRLDESASFLGRLAMWQMVGQSLGNLFAAWLGDRWGGRATLAFGLLLMAAATPPALLISTPLQAQAIYALFGFAMMMLMVGKDTLLLELSPVQGQAAYLSGMSFVTMLAITGFALISPVLWREGAGFAGLVVMTTGCCLVGFLALSWVEDPRTGRISAWRAIRRGFLRYLR